MKTNGIVLTVVLAMLGAVTIIGQQQAPDPERTPGVQAAQDPGRQAFLEANCRVVPEPPAGRGGGRGRGGGGGNPNEHQPYTIAGIPGVITAGSQWRTLWVDTGNNADSPIGVEDGVLVAQNDKSQILKVGLDGHVELVATDTYTGGALAMAPDGSLFIGERALNRGIWRVDPRTPFATTINGEPLECQTAGVLNDMIADAKGGMYMTMGGVYYANPQGEVSGPFGTVGGNGLTLSPDGSVLYVTGRMDGVTPPANIAVPAGAPEPTGGLRAYDVQPDGSLANERQFAWAGGDGTAVDSEGRIYSTGNGGTWVISPQGDILGFIAAPRGMISVSFGGPGGHTLFGVSIRDVEIFAIDMISHGM